MGGKNNGRQVKWPRGWHDGLKLKARSCTYSKESLKINILCTGFEDQYPSKLHSHQSWIGTGEWIE